MSYDDQPRRTHGEQPDLGNAAGTVVGLDERRHEVGAHSGRWLRVGVVTAHTPSIATGVRHGAPDRFGRPHRTGCSRSRRRPQRSMGRAARWLTRAAALAVTLLSARPAPPHVRADRKCSLHFLPVPPAIMRAARRSGSREPCSRSYLPRWPGPIRHEDPRCPRTRQVEHQWRVGHRFGSAVTARSPGNTSVATALARGVDPRERPVAARTRVAAPKFLPRCSLMISRA
jgi:hypothetical protein